MDFLKNNNDNIVGSYHVVGCSDDDESINGREATISLSTILSRLIKMEETLLLQWQCSGDWRLAGVCDWAHPSVMSGKVW
jgi:hypothetical protein